MVQHNVHSCPSKKSIYHLPLWKFGCGNPGFPFPKCLTFSSSMPSGSMAKCRWKGGPRGGKGRGILNLSGRNMGPLCIFCGGKCGMLGGERNGGMWGPGVPAGGCSRGKPGRGPGMIPGSGRAITGATTDPSCLASSSVPAEITVKRLQNMFSVEHDRDHPFQLTSPFR